jgi:type II secretory pathway component GspD/PulD (secretin)
VVPTDPVSPVRGIERPSDETSGGLDDRRRRRDEEPVSQSARGTSAQFVAFVQETDDDSADQAASETTDATAETPETAADGERREIAPGIFIQVQGDELILMSEDEEALDRLEEMLEESLQMLPPTTAWKLFMLESADATMAAEMLEQLIPDATVSQVTNSATSSGFFGSLSSMGSSLVSASGLSSSPAGGLRIIPDLRLNALYVSGPASKVAEVREFLRFIDASNIGGTARDRLPHMIPVKYAEVADVHRMVRDLYRDYLEGEPAAAAANPFAMFMGGGGGRNGRDQQQQQAKEYKLTIGMDEQTSHLIVSADEGLYQEILELVTSIDNAAREARRTVKVVELENASTSAVQNTLGAVMPRVRVSSTGARTSRTDSSSSNGSNGTSSSSGSPGQQQQGPSQDQMRQWMEQRMRERMMGGGGSGGEGRSFFFGGNRGGGGGGDNNRGGDGGDRGRGRWGRN